MANLTGSNSTNITSHFPNRTTVEGETQDVSNEVGWIVTIVINSTTCPFTVLFNVLVIMAVKRRPRLQSNANILLACLAVTDVLTGLIVQPAFVGWKTFQLRRKTHEVAVFVSFLHSSFMRSMNVCSCLHLMLITYERLVAIKFTMRYPYIVTRRNIKLAVIAFWLIAIFCGVCRVIRSQSIFSNSVYISVLVLCSIFIPFAYTILYFETRRHHMMIKIQQLPQEEVERFTKENKAFKTSVLVVAAVMLCFIPAILSMILFSAGMMKRGSASYNNYMPWVRTITMLNSLLNPLIYC